MEAALWGSGTAVGEACCGSHSTAPKGIYVSPFFFFFAIVVRRDSIDFPPDL